MVDRRKYFYAAGLLAALALLFWAGTWYGRTGTVSSSGKRVLYYVDPMNPSHTSPDPGIAPCGMKMEPVYADAAETPDGPALPPGSVKITPERQQLIGVKVAKVEETPWTYNLRALGTVAVPENRIYQVNAYIDGWIVRAYPNSTGSIVRRDEPLASYYSKELPTALQSFFYAAHASESLSEGVKLPKSQAEALDAQKKLAEGSLMNLGVNRLQIDELARTRQITQEINIYAPVTSFILSRKITPGQKFTAGQELYRLADLSQVWVLADLYGNEANYIKPGEKVRVKLPKQKENFLATVSEILPEFNPNTLTLKVRLEVDNPNFMLRPGMFTDVEFPIKMPPSLNVPADAVMDSGLKQLVFVDRGNGFFEPRQVKLGWRLGDRVEITDGLKPGESIVTSGNFLIDSESRMRLAAAGMFGEVVRDPVCGLNVDADKAKAAGWQSTVNDTTYSFCSPSCKDHFEKTPKNYVEPAVAAPAAGFKPPEKDSGVSHTETAGHHVPETSGMVLDPVCGLPVTAEMAKGRGWTSEYEGKIFYFDTEGCKQRFDKDPRRYLTGSETVFSGSYQHFPTDPNLLLRLRRDFLGSLPTWKTQELPGPLQVEPQVLPPAPQTSPPPADPGQHQAPASGSPAPQPQGQAQQQPAPVHSPDACHDEEQKP